MEKDVLNEPLMKERSYVKSMSAGVRLPLRHPWGFLRHMWPMMVLCMLVWAVVAQWAAPNMWALRNEASVAGVSPADLLTKNFIMCCAWGGLAIVFLGIQCGQISYLMQRYGELTYLPAVQPWKVMKDITPHIVRGIILCVVGYAVTLGWCVLSLLFMPSRLWALVLFVILTILWAMVYVPAGQQYMLDKRSFLSSLAYPFKHLGSVGGSSAVLVVCGMVVVCVMVAGCLPALSTIYVGGMSDQAVAIGDGTDLPSSFALVRSICFAMGALIIYISWPFILVPLVFQWAGKGSEETIADAEE